MRFPSPPRLVRTRRPDAPRRRWTGWWIGFWVATALTLAYPSQHYFGSLYRSGFGDGPRTPTMPWTTWLLFELPVWYSWLAMTPGVIWIARRYPLTGAARVRNLLAVHLPAGVALVVAHISLLSVYRLVLPVPLPAGVGLHQVILLSIIQYFASMLTVYATIVAVYHAIWLYQEAQARALHASQLETHLANARLDALKMQLHPHFLFNALNTIASLVFKDARAAQRMIVRLGDLLRLSLEGSSAHEVPLADELEFLRQYADIQQVRFSDRLALEYDVEPGTERLLVPRLILQPLVENAVRHAVEPGTVPVRIVVRSRRDGQTLRLEVEDDGPGISLPAATRSTGIGLRNTRARLQQLYGPAHAFVLQPREPRGVLVKVSFPARTDHPSDLAVATP